MSNDNHDNDDNKPMRDAQGQWLPGHCPNPRGRPKKRLVLHGEHADIHHFGNSVIEAKIQGQTQLLTRRAMLNEKIFENAMKGKVSSQRLLHKEFEKSDERLAEIRLYFDDLVRKWLVDHPDRRRPEFSVPDDIMKEILDLLKFLNRYYPDVYPLDYASNYDGAAEEEDVRIVMALLDT
jgi:hypothetical protein